ncbi:hypothetical protein H0H87_004415 [Tephrocybe sp. NHM501043]|nr:hypothetical protein H0H87_004415 [Tephrocybe sp. NHM501043]
MGKLSIFGFLYEQLSKVQPVVNANLTGQTVVVIGANTGLGFEACKHFARMHPYRIIMACRSESKGESAVQKLQQETGYEGAELWIVDLSCFASVIAFADKFEKDGGRLDILVANAAIASVLYTPTADDWELSLQVNCLSLFLLALRLLPQMIKTASEHNTHPRLVTVTSEVHFWSQLQKTMPEKDIYKTINTKEYCTSAVMEGRYMDTKRNSLQTLQRDDSQILTRNTVLDILFYQALNERLGPRSPIIVSGVNPGFCLSEIRRELNTGARGIFLYIMESLIARTTEQGSRQLIYAAVGGEDDLDMLRGAYISCARVSEASDYALEEHDVQDKLWVRHGLIHCKLNLLFRRVK